MKTLQMDSVLEKKEIFFVPPNLKYLFFQVICNLDKGLPVFDVINISVRKYASQYCNKGRDGNPNNHFMPYS